MLIKHVNIFEPHCVNLFIYTYNNLKRIIKLLNNYFMNTMTSKNFIVLFVHFGPQILTNICYF
jgi:hypothetical protein